MLLRSLADQLVRDLKTSWQRTAILGVLLIVGLVLWIPPLVRAVLGHAAPPTPNPVSPQASAIASIQAESFLHPQPTTAKPEKPTGYSWENIDEKSQSDVLIRSADVSRIPGGAFQMDHDQFSPPVLFAEEPKKKSKSASVATTVAKTSILDELRLKSTVIGAKRRAALINRKLYFEGMNIRTANGGTYLLEAIFERKVVLKRGNERIELKIAKRSSAANMELKRQSKDERR